MKTRLLAILIAIPLVIPAFGGEPTKQDSFIKKLLKYLKPSLRQSVLDKNFIEMPAMFQFVHPSANNKSNSYSIDAGLTWKLVDNSTWMVGPTVEYHRHTETSTPQNNIQVGLTGINILGEFTNGFAMYTQATIKYKSDRIVTGDGLLAKIDFSPLRKALGLGSDIRLFGLKQLTYRWKPTLGFQYETASNVLATGQSGKVARFFASIGLGIYPFPESHLLHHNLEFSVIDSYWLNIDRTGGFNEYNKYHNLFQVSLTYYFDNSHHFGLGIDYFNGENPELGLLKQTDTMIALKTKF
jgi:hypothetical protein